MSSWELPVALLSGAAAGGGLHLFVSELLPATPALGPALNRLQPPDDSATAGERTAQALGGWGFVVRFLTVPTRDLAILAMGTDAYLSSLVLSAATAFFLPAVVTLLLRMAGYQVALLLPVGIGLLTAAGAAYLAHRDVTRRAKVARAEFARAFCTYVDLVVLEMAAAGPVQSLERAARIGHGWVYDRINNALLQAQLEMRFPWEHLRKLGHQTQVTELHDLAAIMQSAGNEGAQVHTTLQEHAQSMRERLRTDQLARAEQVSAQLEMPAALLVIVLAFFMIYPLMARI